MASSSSSPGAGELPRPVGEKPVVVRVKRKSHHSRLDAFWLEINERPWKRQMFELEKLSINGSSGDSSRGEELGQRKVLVKHVETVIGSTDAIDVVQSVVMPNSVEASESATRIEERKQAFKKHNKQEQLLSKARQNQETLAKSIRFEQIWRSRRGNKEASGDKAVHDVCHFYDIVRVDDEESPSKMQEHEELSLEDQRLLSSYLPLLREFIPSAAAEIESDLHPSTDRDDYVYDYYTVEDDMAMKIEDASCTFPLVQVEEDDYYDGPDDESECDSNDSNAENHPHNEYPDESESEDEDEDEEEEEEEDEEEEGETMDTEEASDGESEQRAGRRRKVQGLFDASMDEDGIADGYPEEYNGDDDLDCRYSSDDDDKK